MKKFLIKTLAVFMAVTATGCNNWLDVSPKTEMKAEDLFANESGFRDALTGVYALMVRSQSYGCNLTYGFLDVLAHYYESPLKNTPSGYPHNLKSAAQFDYTTAGVESSILEIWSNQYTAIANTNLALQYTDIKRDIFTSEASYQMYKGEFLALRAWLHFDMLRLFASSGAMDGGKGLDNPAIPYLETYTNLAQPQLTGRQVLAKIEKDLTDAKALMKDHEEITVGNKRQNKINYYAVTALLARAYLYAGDHANALAQAKEIIGEANGEIPTKYVLASNPATPNDPMFLSEIIFSLDIQKLKDLSESYLSKAVASSTNLLTMSNAGYNNIYRKSDADPGSGSSVESEYRASWMKIHTDGKSMVLDKYADKDFIPVLKISEMFLIAAECAGPQEGIAYLNKLRNHRGLGNIDTSISLEEGLLREYRREFIGEGQMFYFYKRKAMDKIGAEGETGVTNLNKVYNLPFPQAEMEFGNIKH